MLYCSNTADTPQCQPPNAYCSDDGCYTVSKALEAEWGQKCSSMCWCIPK